MSLILSSVFDTRFWANDTYPHKCRFFCLILSFLQYDRWIFNPTFRLCSLPNQQRFLSDLSGVIVRIRSQGLMIFTLIIVRKRKICSQLQTQCGAFARWVPLWKYVGCIVVCSMYFGVCLGITYYLYAAQGGNRPKGQFYYIFLIRNWRELFGYSDNFTPLVLTQLKIWGNTGEGMKTTVKPLKGKISSYSEIRKLPVGACVLDPQIQRQMRLKTLTQLNSIMECIPVRILFMEKRNPS